MLDHSNDRARLALADTHISEGERRIARLEAYLGWCRATGHDIEQAEQLLCELEGNLTAWYLHRDELLRDLR